MEEEKKRREERKKKQKKKKITGKEFEYGYGYMSWVVWDLSIVLYGSLVLD